MKLSGVSNSGWTFTEERLKQLNIMFHTIEKLEGKTYSYKEIQYVIEENNLIVNASKVRMFFPFLKKCGIITYENKEININNYLTDLGIKFKLYLDIYEIFLENMDNNTEMRKIIDDIMKEFIFIFLKKLTNESNLYKIITKILLKKNSITYNEFFIITDNYSKSIEDIYYILSQIENLNNVNVEIEKHKNAWQYVINLYEESGLVKIEKQTAVLLTGQKIKLEKLLTGDKND